MEVNKDAIIDLILWYRDLPKDYNSIIDIMDCRKDLSTYTVLLGVDIGKKKKQVKLLDSAVSRKENQKKIEYIAKSYSFSKMDVLIKGNPMQERKERDILEAELYELEYIFKSVREVLSEMNQRIAFLREELKQNNFFNS